VPGQGKPNVTSIFRTCGIGSAQHATTSPDDDEDEDLSPQHGQSLMSMVGMVWFHPALGFIPRSAIPARAQQFSAPMTTPRFFGKQISRVQ